MVNIWKKYVPMKITQYNTCISLSTTFLMKYNWKKKLFCNSVVGIYFGSTYVKTKNYNNLNVK